MALSHESCVNVARDNIYSDEHAKTYEWQMWHCQTRELSDRRLTKNGNCEVSPRRAAGRSRHNSPRKGRERSIQLLRKTAAAHLSYRVKLRTPLRLYFDDRSSASMASVLCGARLNVCTRRDTFGRTSSGRYAGASRGDAHVARGFKVELQHQGKTHTLDVKNGDTILNAALDKGIDLPHDCNLGVCMTCPAKLLGGKVDQSGSMLSDDVAQKGYALLCVSVPQSDCKIQTVEEEELLALTFNS